MKSPTHKTELQKYHILTIIKKINNCLSPEYNIIRDLTDNMDTILPDSYKCSRKMITF